jgi:hypothetical protein
VVFAEKEWRKKRNKKAPQCAHREAIPKTDLKHISFLLLKGGFQLEAKKKF